MNDIDVIIAGAGPVGLLLAAELRLAGVKVAVLERLTEQSNALKAGAINGRSTQIFGRLGLRKKLNAESAKYNNGFDAFVKRPTKNGDEKGPASRFAGQFAGLILKASPELQLPIGTVLPQQALERFLKNWATELGVQILTGHDVVGFTENVEGITVEAKTDQGQTTFQVKYLVGCDGGRSAVRKLAGFEFPGTAPIITGRQAIVTLNHPERLEVGWNITDTGLFVHSMPGRIMMVEFDGPPADRDAPITIDELQGSLQRVSGVDVTITSLETATRYTDHSRQATTYKKGRVLLAGDAAHIHPPFGGQGMNTGLQDADNLGWKLAAAVQGWAPSWLLDTYTTERYPVAEQVLMNTRAQVAIMRPDARSRAMRSLFSEMVKVPEVTNQLVSRLQGLDIHYEFDQETHPLVGHHVPEIPGMEDGMRYPFWVLFDFTNSSALQAVVKKWKGRVNICNLPHASDLTAMLVRPDGYVAWAIAEESDDKDYKILYEILSNWCGQEPI